MLTVQQRAHHWPLTAAPLPVIYGGAARAAISAALFPRVPPHGLVAESARPGTSKIAPCLNVPPLTTSDEQMKEETPCLAQVALTLVSEGPPRVFFF